MQYDKTFEHVAAEIAALSNEDRDSGIGGVFQALARRHHGRDVVTFISLSRWVIDGGGSAVVRLSRIGIETGLKQRSLDKALAALEGAGIVLIEPLNEAFARVTLPGILSHMDVDDHAGRGSAKRFAPETRVLH